MVNFFGRNQTNKQDIKAILHKSIAAQCGITEREVTVPSEKVSSTISKLKSSGYSIVGTSYGKTKTKKVWFVGAVRFQFHFLVD